MMIIREEASEPLKVSFSRRMRWRGADGVGCYYSTPVSSAGCGELLRKLDDIFFRDDILVSTDSSKVHVWSRYTLILFITISIEHNIILVVVQPDTLIM